MNFSIALKAFLEALIEPIIKRPVKFNNLKLKMQFHFHLKRYQTVEQC